MKTQAYFENIQEQIIQELGNAKESIHIAVAWFTDDKLFNLVCDKARSGLNCELIIMNDEINNQAGINYDNLTEAKGKLFKITGDKYGKNLMHNKFCVLDGKTVINGSYNWTKKAKTNHESITIIYDSPEIALDFLEEFNSIKNKYFDTGEDKEYFDVTKIIIRLDTLKNVVLLEDREDINWQLKKLQNVIKPKGSVNEFKEVFEIIHFIEQGSFGQAIEAINSFINKYRQLEVYIDSEVFAYKLEIKGLELIISALEDEKTEIEKLIYQFDLRYNRELGELILKLLELKRDKLKEELKTDESKKQEYEETEKDFEDFNKNYKESHEQVNYDISDEQKIELRNKFRKASKLCHPDVVAEEFKKEAEKVFIELKQAYEQNDMETVNEIYSNLESGIFKSTSAVLFEKEKLKTTINKLRIKQKHLERIVVKIKSEKIYLEIYQIMDWDFYFKEMKDKLINEIKKYE